MSASPVRVGDVQRDGGVEWVVVSPPIIAEHEDDRVVVIQGAVRVRRGSLAHAVHSADPRIAASLPMVKP